MSVLDVKNISYGYRKEKLILDSISFSVNQGEKIALLGLNGSGKSTLLKIISGILQPNDGDVILNHQYLKEMQPRLRGQTVTFLSQSLSVLFSYTVEDFIKMGRYPWQKTFMLHQNDILKVRTVMSDLELMELKDREYSTLSGGEQQRVRLARCLVQDSPLILLDEPLTHLDIKQKESFMNLICQSKHVENKAILCVLHDLSKIESYFDRVLILSDSHLVFDGPAKEAINPERVKNIFGV